MIDVRQPTLGFFWMCVLASQSALASGFRPSQERAAPVRPGAVFTMTDAADGNAVVAFSRADDGALTPAGMFATGGLGSGGGEGVLGSQGSLTLSDDGRFLFAVNAGSDDVSSFRVQGAQLQLASRVASGGTLPVSVAEHHGLVYVLNAGGSGGLTGFSLDGRGRLTPLSGASLPLSSASAGPAQVGFDPWGESVIVSEKGSQSFDVYLLDLGGQPVGPASFPSAGVTPFGFSFTPGGTLVVSEAEGGNAGASTVSSYDDLAGFPVPVSKAVPDGQSAACWAVTTADGRFAYISNAASGDLSAYAVGLFGRLTLTSAAAATLPQGKPLDLALAGHDRFLYVLDAANHAVAGFARGRGGDLASLSAGPGGLPESAVGLAAR